MQLRVVSWFALVVAATSVAIALVGSPGPVAWPAPAVHPPLRIGYALEAPYARRDNLGQLDGEAIEVMRALLARLG
jgi:polar amino acid transport system substrate-binding protein